MNNSPDVIDSINSFPVAQVAGKTVFMRDIAHVHDGFQVQPTLCRWTAPRSIDHHPQNRGVSTLAVIDECVRR